MSHHIAPLCSSMNHLNRMQLTQAVKLFCWGKCWKYENRQIDKAMTEAKMPAKVFFSIYFHVHARAHFHA